MVGIWRKWLMFAEWNCVSLLQWVLLNSDIPKAKTFWKTGGTALPLELTALEVTFEGLFWAQKTWSPLGCLVDICILLFQSVHYEQPVASPANLHVTDLKGGGECMERPGGWCAEAGRDWERGMQEPQEEAGNVKKRQRAHEWYWPDINLDADNIS